MSVHGGGLDWDIKPKRQARHDGIKMDHHNAAAFLAREWMLSCLWSFLDLSAAVMFYFRHLSMPQNVLRQGIVPFSLLQLIACAAIVCAVTLILGRLICNKPSQGRGRLAPSFARYERNYALRTVVYQDAPQLVITLYCARRLGFEDSVMWFSMVSSAVSMGYALHRVSTMRQRRSLAPRGNDAGREPALGNVQRPCAGRDNAVRLQHRQTIGGARP